MRSPTIKIFSALLASTTIVSAQYPVPVPWQITHLSMQNERHGTGGWWSFNITDTPTTSPQGFTTQACYYYGSSAADFATQDYPIDAPCNAQFPELTFTLGPSARVPRSFDFNITHLWGDGGNDNASWIFSANDVLGQESDVANNFGQAGSFERDLVTMYPLRSEESTEPWP